MIKFSSSTWYSNIIGGSHKRVEEPGSLRKPRANLLDGICPFRRRFELEIFTFQIGAVTHLNGDKMFEKFEFYS